MTSKSAADLVDVDVLEVRDRALGPRVVHDRVDPPEPLDGRVEDVACGAGRGRVDGDRDDLGPSGQGVDLGLEGGGGQVHEHEMRVALGQGVGDRAAELARGAASR